MANDHSYRNEPIKIREYPCIPAQAINIGDLVWYDTSESTLKKASTILPWTTETRGQEALASSFAGVALKQSLAVSDNRKLSPVSVAVSGLFEMECPSTTFVIGDLVGGVELVDALDNQRVTKVLTSNTAIGRVVYGGTSLTKVVFEIFPRFNAPMFVSRDEIYIQHGITVSEASAGEVVIDTELSATSFFLFQHITASTDLQNITTSVTVSGGVFTFTEGGTAMASGDLIMLYAKR